jgi:hypothetical protein
MDSQILRLTSGYINNINDAVIGGLSGIGGISKFAGQLGKTCWLDDSMIQYTGSTAFFGGRFRYVRLAAAAGAVALGQILFWDTSVADNLYQVTDSETTSSTNSAMMRAGINLNPSWTAGNYGIIQDIGPVPVKFRAVLTAAGVKGDSVYAAAAGGADLGLADQLGSANPTLFSDVQLMQGRYIGSALSAPAGGATSLVYVNFTNIRG